MPLSLERLAGPFRLLSVAENAAALEREFRSLLEALAPSAQFDAWVLDQSGEALLHVFRERSPEQPAPPSIPIAAAGEGAERAIAEGRPAWRTTAGAITGWLPLQHAGVVFGVLRLRMAEEDAGGEPDAWRILAEGLAGAVITLRLRATLTTQLTEAQTRIQALTDLGAKLNTLEPSAVAARFLGMVLRLTASDVGTLLVPSADGWTEEHEMGLPAATALAVLARSGRSAATDCVRTREAILVEAMRPSDPQFAFFPLFGASGILGVACIARGAGRPPYRPAELDLAQSMAPLAATAMQNARFHAAALAQERLNASLDAAREIQKGLLPDGSLRVFGMQIAHRGIPSEIIGGDYIDMIPAGPGVTRIVIGDVTGHGIGPALLMTSTRAALRLLQENRPFEPQLVERLNSFLAGNVLHSGRLMTLVLAEVDAASGSVRYVNAGHNPALLLGADGRTRRVLEATGLPLGVTDNATYECIDETLAPGEALVFYTDGFVEARSPSGERFGMARFRNVLEEGPADAEARLDFLLSELHSHCASRPADDDQSIVIMRRLPVGEEQERAQRPPHERGDVPVAAPTATSG